MSTGVELPKGGILGRLSRGVAIIGVLAAGVIASAAILAYEREVPGTAQAHDDSGEKKKDGGHAHETGEKKDAGGHAHEGEAAADHKHDEAEGGHAHGDEEEGHGKAVKFTAKQRENAKLVIETAGPAAIKQTLILNGIIQPNEEKTVAVLPRFGGIVRNMGKRLGDRVKKGEVVARIESNESLTQYEIQAPMDGTVIERSGTLGEFAATDKRLMAISDLSTVWVDLRVYSQDFSKLKVGQKVDVALPGHDEVHSASISYLSPIGVTDTQSMLARAVVENGDGGFLPGLFVTGHVLLSEQPAAVAVKQSALQYIDGKPVVFIEDEDGFEKRDIALGVKDDTMIEIVSGVAAGDKVVVGNSFILKAELGKGEAEHVH